MKASDIRWGQNSIYLCLVKFVSQFSGQQLLRIVQFLKLHELLFAAGKNVMSFEFSMVNKI